MKDLETFIFDLIEDWERSPDKHFLKTSQQNWSYGDLLMATQSLCIDLGDEPKSRAVGILANKSLTAYAAVIACLIRGRVFVPVNSHWPIDRIKKIQEKLKIESFIVDENSQDISLGAPKINLRHDYIKNKINLTQWKLNEVKDSDLAYIMMTSGSTGEPKGVCVARSNLGAFLNKIISLIKIDSKDILSQTYDLNFDPSLADIFLATKNLASLCPSDKNDHLNYLDFIKRSKITILSWVPTLAEISFQRCREKNLSFKVKKTIFTGEALKKKTLEEWRSLVPTSLVYNFYGPTECVVWTHYCELTGKDLTDNLNKIVSIGKPLEALKIKISKNQEMWISGDQVAGGYYEEKQLTQERFKSEHGELWYNTGDLVSQDEAGNFHFNGRKDRQIKIAGQRFDLSEIESCVQSWCSRVMSMATVAKQGEFFYAVELIIDTRLDGDRCISLLDYLKQEIPSLFVPKKIFYLEKFTETPHSKIDYKRIEDLKKSNKLIELSWVR